MSQVSVSIIIVNFNTFQLTCNCIASIQLHEQELDYEIILVDNNSSEVAAIEFKKRFPSILLIQSVTNLGFARGNNLGIAQAGGKYILLLNSDTLLVNKAISYALHVLSQQKDVGIVAARLEYPDGKPQHNCQRFPSFRYKLFELFRLQKLLGKRLGGKTLLGSFFNHNSAVYPDWVWGTFFVFRREILLELPLGKLDDTFFMYGEDMQWCYDFRKLGYRIAFEPKAKVIHYMGMSGAKKNEMMVGNLKEFMRRHYSPAKIWILDGIDFLLALRR